MDESGNGFRSGVPRKFRAQDFVPERMNAEISKRYKMGDAAIGQGGFGKVFVADDLEVPGRRVAIKRVKVADEEKLRAFQQEARIMKDLDHPHICRLLEIYREGNVMCFVMELCEGGELFDRIIASGGIEEHSAAQVVQQVAGALLHAHSKGIAHRDLKPENCCFCSADKADNQIKVLDWGVSFYFGLSAMRSGVGSLMYTAPEVLDHRGRPDGYTQACDLWSLGVMTYVMLCGKPPFWGSPTQQFTRMTNEVYPMSDATWKAISDEAKDFIRRLLRVDTRVRLTSAAALQHPWLRNQPVCVDPSVSQLVLSNLRTFTRVSHFFFAICAASVARQLDHRQLQELRSVFNEMDTNKDGMLDLNELRGGFEKVFGPTSDMVLDIEQIFAKLDLDGSGSISYSEFCAAGWSEQFGNKEAALRAAFKAFDVVEDDGRLTREELETVLASVGESQSWSPDVCAEVTKEIFEQFDENGDGILDFGEWLQLVQELRKPAAAQVPDPEPVSPRLLGNLARPDKLDKLDPNSPSRARKAEGSPRFGAGATTSI